MEIEIFEVRLAEPKLDESVLRQIGKEIPCHIVFILECDEEQQHGEARAEYGRQFIAKLSQALTEQFGKGFSEDTLKNARKFYLTYKDRISETVFSLFEKGAPFTLPWSHYLQLNLAQNKRR